jgi:isopenicillin N synthase-like dioxygenase
MVSVPVIDLRKWVASTTTDKGTNDTLQQKDEACSNANDATDDEEFVRLATELVQALEQWGFVTLVNHGISKEAIHSALGVSRQFFSLDESSKNRCAYRGHDCNCGYIGVGQESHATGAADAKETFDVGPEPVSPGGCGDGGDTPWPRDEEQDGFSGERFKATLVSYFEECNHLQLHLLKLIAVGLGLPSSDYLAAQCDERHCNLRLLHYPSHRFKVSHGTRLKATADNNKQLDERVIVRGARHTDFGTLTLLAQDDVGGLRVQPRRHPMGEPSDAPWIHVAPVEGALVLNVGDMLQRWTNDRLVATPHQVVSVLPPHEPAAPMVSPNQGDDATTDIHIPERYSIAFFCNANKDTVLRPIPCLVQAHEGPKYEAVTAKEYLTRRLAETINPPTAS